jgi:hypothetical protein
MTAIVSGDRYKTPFAGEDGNASTWSGYYKFPAPGAIGDTIDLFEIPAGAKVDEITEVHSAHGGSAALTIGFKYKDGSTAGAAVALSATSLKASFSTVAAGNSTIGLMPSALFGTDNGKNTNGIVDKPILVYLTNSGSAIPSAGEIYVKASGEFVGTK